MAVMGSEKTKQNSVLYSRLVPQRSIHKYVSWNECYRCSRRVRRTEYEEQIRDLELLIPKEGKLGTTWMSSNIWSTFIWRGCFSRQQNWIHVSYIFKAGQGVRRHLAQGVQIIFHLFASAEQLVGTIWNSVLRRVLRLSPRLPGGNRCSHWQWCLLWKKRDITTQVPCVSHHRCGP